MKHRYNPMVFVLTTLFCVSCCLTIFYLFPDFIREHSDGRRGVGPAFVGVTLLLPTYLMLDNLNRSVEILSEYVKFNNFRLNSFNKLKSFSVTLSYESITGLDSKKLPLIGIYKILVISKNYPDPIPVSMLFLKHKQLFYTLCKGAKRFNRDVIIDDDLQEFMEKHREEFD